MPKYNILLKDDKGYPYLRLNRKEIYPVITLVNKIADDGAEYFGPYGSRGVTNALLEAIRLTLKLPGCNKEFPRDVGKGRPCLNYHMNQCEGWCQPGKAYAQYKKRIDQADEGHHRQQHQKGLQPLLRGKQAGIRTGTEETQEDICRMLNNHPEADGTGKEYEIHSRMAAGKSV